MTEPRNPATSVARSVDDNIIAGVCGGLGEQFGINAWWFRWAFIILTFFGFAGVFLYILAWVLIPKENEDGSVATSWMDGLDLTDVGTIFGVVLIGVAGVIILNQFFHVSGALVAAGVLAIVGVLLYRGDLRPPDKPDKETQHNIDEDAPASDAGTDTEEPTPADTPTAGAPVVAATVETKPKKTPKPPKERKPKRPQSMLGRLTMAVMLIALSTMAIIELADVAHFQPFEYAGVAMGVVALGLLVGAWIGRAYWLIFIGLLIAPFLFFSSFIPKISDWSMGDPGHQPTSVQDVRSGYDLGIGQLTIDLTQLTADELAEVGVIRAEVGLGQLLVRLPDDVGATVDAEVGIGAITGRSAFDGSTFDSYEYSGVGVDQRFEIGPPPHELHLDLEVGMGEISINRVGIFDVSAIGSER